MTVVGAVGIARQVLERGLVALDKCREVSGSGLDLLAGAVRFGPSDDVCLQQGLQARAAPRGRRLMDGDRRRIGVLTVDRGRCLS
jgi:hypothetical protein